MATPIGNLGDLGGRAREVLSRVGTVAAEDTRTARKLLSAAGARPRRVLSLREHNEREASGRVAELIESGEDVAYVTDAGTPGISDPGAVLVGTMRARGIRVEPIPGPSAPVAAASVSGMCAQGFLFLGFLPRRRGDRERSMAMVDASEVAVVLHESPRRITALLAELRGRLGAGRDACVCRELTKVHEQVVAGTLGELEGLAADGTIPGRGEFTLVIAPSPRKAPAEPELEDAVRLCELLAQEIPPGRAATVVSRHAGVPRAELYGRLLKARGSGR